jgi:hypothetical protein
MPINAHCCLDKSLNFLNLLTNLTHNIHFFILSFDVLVLLLSNYCIFLAGVSLIIELLDNFFRFVVNVLIFYLRDLAHVLIFFIICNLLYIYNII